MMTLVRGVIKARNHFRRNPKTLRLVRFQQHILATRITHNVL